MAEADLDDLFSSRPYYYSRYFIDGFRSLHSFNVRLEEGINVLVGPNGSGKTNFIDFLDFLSSTVNRDASNAVSSSGGIARVFSQESLKSRYPRIVANITGLASLRAYSGEHERSLFRFEYSIDIRYSKPHAAIFIAYEALKLKSMFWDDLAVNVDSTVGTLSLRRASPIDEEARWEVGTRLLSSGPKNPLRYRNRSRRASIGEQATDELLVPPTLAADESFLSLRPGYPALEAVRTALSRGRSFNLNPSIARAPDDLSAPPVIRPDGSGLSSTLYHLQQAKKGQPSRVLLYTRRFDDTMLDSIVAWTTLVLPELQDITCVADPHTGKYIAYLIVDAGDSSLKVPLQAASDGTVKWLSFVSLITTQGSAYALEEPENFLHPKMQRFLVTLIRESMDKEHPGHFILSTHSESIINHCRPEELILFEFRGGRTTCKRLDNPNSVAQQINKTGFGLGYYFAANAVS